MRPILPDEWQVALRRGVLETAAGTGIVTRQLRDALPARVQLTATDLNPPMIEVARNKFRSSENVDLRSADATALPFPDAAFDAVVCEFGVMFFPDKAKSYQEVYRVLAPGGRYLFNVWDSHRYNPFGRISHEVAGSFFPADPPPVLQGTVLLSSDRSDQGIACWRPGSQTSRLRSSDWKRRSQTWNSSREVWFMAIR